MEEMKKSSIFTDRDFCHIDRVIPTQDTITCSKVAIEMLEKGVKYIQS